MQDIIFSYANLDVRAASVFDLVFDNSPCASTSSSTWGTVTGVRLGARYAGT
jgi:tRNA uridine 5-carboxymethylaminomethyl modification enzyme